jgi:hypothetical protein
LSARESRVGFFGQYFDSKNEDLIEKEPFLGLKYWNLLIKIVAVFS